MEIRTRTIERLRDALIESGSRKDAVTSSAYRTLARRGLLSNEEKEAIARVEIVAEAMFLVMAADKEITDTELAALKGAIVGLAGSTLNDDIVRVLVENYALRLQDEGLEVRLKALAASLSQPDEAESVFSLASAVALADDQLAATESAVLDSFQKALKLSDAQVARILGELRSDAEAPPV